MRRGVRICCFIGGFRWLWVWVVAVGGRMELDFSIFFFLIDVFVCFVSYSCYFSVISGMGN